MTVQTAWRCPEWLSLFVRRLGCYSRRLPRHQDDAMVDQQAKMPTIEAHSRSTGIPWAAQSGQPYGIPAEARAALIGPRQVNSANEVIGMG